MRAIWQAKRKAIKEVGEKSTGQTKDWNFIALRLGMYLGG
jgi:hypothetical protein